MSAGDAQGLVVHLPQASSLAAPVDRLLFAMLGLCAVAVLAVVATIVWFCIKYRKGSKADRSGARSRNLGIEDTWIAIPLLLFVAAFVWGGVLFARIRHMPDDALVIYVVAKQWMWKAQHPQGRREIDQVHVPLGRKVRLVMTSQDAIHSFFVPAFRLKQDVLPGRYTSLWFEPTQLGRFALECAEFCGTDHSRMRGEVVVMRPRDYARWLERGEGDGMAAQGEQLFRRFGCSGCHAAGAAVRAPDLEGLYGRVVPLADGGTVVADERYIRDSILLPRKQVAAGYVPIMPSFAGRLGEGEVLQLMAYLKSTAEEPVHLQHTREAPLPTPSFPRRRESMDVGSSAPLDIEHAGGTSMDSRLRGNDEQKQEPAAQAGRTTGERERAP